MSKGIHRDALIQISVVGVRSERTLENNKKKHIKRTFFFDCIVEKVFGEILRYFRKKKTPSKEFDTVILDRIVEHVWQVPVKILGVMPKEKSWEKKFKTIVKWLLE